jgi:hypothetical protein
MAIRPGSVDVHSRVAEYGAQISHTRSVKKAHLLYHSNAAVGS